MMFTNSGNINIFSIYISSSEWKELENHISCKRKKFLAHFTNLLTFRLQEKSKDFLK